MFHDPTLDRTTNGTGAIKTQPWKGVIEFVIFALPLLHLRFCILPPRFGDLVILIFELGMLERRKNLYNLFLYLKNCWN